MSRWFPRGACMLAVAALLWAMPLLPHGAVHARRVQDAPKQPIDSELGRVIAELDRAAAKFHTAQAKFVWTQYTSVVNEKDVQEGMVYFRRAGRQVEMAADITKPTPKQVLFTDSKVQLYQPNIDQVTQYDTGKNRALVESFLVLGFGGSGQDMLKSFTVSYLGRETVDGIATAKLDLIPKSEKARNTFEHICLWIDLTRGVSVQQQLFAPENDYRLASYSDIHLDEKIPDSAFKLRTSGNSRFLPPKG
ncbi:MAG TPA: outer-membrane lipoprotein carrier protein LolA [Terriglobales bacterium]|nr:outer-membrane lipoprotein carrier protein LolA [Terriglobales bacterium]